MIIKIVDFLFSRRTENITNIINYNIQFLIIFQNKYTQFSIVAKLSYLRDKNYFSHLQFDVSLKNKNTLAIFFSQYI